jgi:hypothetical protein
MESYELSKGSYFENGLTGIAVDCNDDILLEIEGGSRRYRLADSQGNLKGAIINRLCG